MVWLRCKQHSQNNALRTRPIRESTRTPERIAEQDQACGAGVGHGHRRGPQGASPVAGGCTGGETPSIGAHGFDDLRLWASEPSGRAGTGDAHHHRVEYSQTTGRDAYRTGWQSLARQLNGTARGPRPGRRTVPHRTAPRPCRAPRPGCAKGFSIPGASSSARQPRRS